MNTYHYTECGLDNVYLHNISIVSDVNGEQVFQIPRINQLHNLIAQCLLNKKGLLNGKEIRFLRTNAGLMQSGLSKLLGKEAQAVGRWERNEHPIDRTTDMLLRMIIGRQMGIDTNPENISELTFQTAANDNININGAGAEYVIMAA